MAYPNADTDWNYILEEARAQFDSLISTLIEGGERVVLLSREGSVPEGLRRKISDGGGLLLTHIPFNDTWTRDYGPITVRQYREEAPDLFTDLELDFGFNGWGLKFAADKDNLVNLALSVPLFNEGSEGFAGLLNYRNCRDFILEGGSLESDGKGTILTTSRCLCSPNRNGGKTKEELEAILSDYLGAEKVLWLDYGFLEGDDTDSHVDTLARLAPDDTIVYVAPPETDTDVHYREFVDMESQLMSFRTREGKPYRLVPLPFPDPVFDDDGQRLPATYANYLVTERNVFIPVYGQPQKDSEAVSRISGAFPAHRVFTVDCSVLIKQHGSLHCSTMQLYS